MKNITTYVCGFSFLNNNLTKDPMLNLKKIFWNKESHVGLSGYGTFKKVS